MSKKLVIVTKRLNQGFDFIVDYSFYIAAFLILFVALIVGYEVLMRRVFNAPTFWVLQTSGYALAFITFLSATKILKEDGHTRMSVVTENLPVRYVKVMNKITSFSSAIVCAILTWRTGLSTYQGYQWGLSLWEGYTIPQYLVWWIMPFGFFLLTIQFIRMGFGYEPEVKDNQGM
ncbi:MAG: hypothetical protein CL743_03835 [Chloroflexi bacterium]|nr:hypothetical protein [Chloroflexota bacterium]|tara:strand:- start:7067 stop:7591 length:525 start_codon:yes stop_codon:yes gene_type:complete